MANLEIIARLKNQMSGEATKIKEDMKGIAQATGEADVKTATLTTHQQALSTEMSKVAAAVGANKAAVEGAGQTYQNLETALSKVEAVAPQVADSLEDMAKGAAKAEEDLKGVTQATGDADVKAAAFAARQRLLASEMNKLAKEVAANKISVEEANKKYQEFEKTLVKLETVTPEVADNLDDIKPPLEENKQSFTELNQAIELVKKAYTVVSQTAQQFYSVLEEGAQIQAAQNTFENLAESIDATAASLNGTLRQATSGMVADLDLMAGANRFVAMGLANTEEEAGKLANIATQLGLAFRGDAAVGMEELALLLANQSIPRLDSFGVSAGKVRERINELQAANAGMSRETAFMTAFMEQAEVTMGKIGDQAGTVAGRLAVMETNVNNLQTSFKATFSQEFIEGINDAANGLFETSDGSQSAGKSMGEFAAQAILVGLHIKTANDFVEELTGNYGKLTGVVRETKQQSEAHRQAVQLEYDAMMRSMTAIDDRRDAIVDHTQAIHANITALSEEATLLYQSSDAYGEFQDKVAQSNAQLTEEEAAFRQSQAAAAAANTALRDRIAAENATVEAEEAAAEATRKHTEAVAAFAAQTGKAFMEAATAGDSLGYFNENLEELGTQMVAVTTGAAANSADFELLQDAYDKAAVKLDKYRLGIEGANLSEEERAEKIAQLSEQMGSYQAQMDALGGSVTTYSERTVTATINQAAVNQALVESIAAAGGSAEQIGAAALALGTMSAAQVEAAMKAAELEIRIAGVRQAYLDGTLTADQLSGAIAQQVEIVNGMTTQMNDASGAINLVGESERTTTQSTQAMIDKFGEVPDEVTTEFVITGDYAGATQAFLDKLNSIPREVDVNVNVHGGGANTNYGAGGYQPMSSGGRVEPFKSYLVGDAPGGGITPYTEMFIPDSPGFIVNNETLQRLMGSNQMGTPAAFGGGGQTSYSDSATIQIVNNFFGAVDQSSVGRLENSQRGIIEQALAERDKRLSAQSRMRS